MIPPAEKAFKGSKTAEDNIFKLLHARFSHLAQNILCDEASAGTVTKRALERIQAQFHEKRKETTAQKSFIQWTQEILDIEIEHFFQELIQEIQKDSKQAENKLMTILHKRFLYLAHRKRNMEKELIHVDDVEEIVQNALQTVYQKSRRIETKGTFIQWAQTVLNNKYRERRRMNIMNKNRFKSLSQEEYEPVYEKRLSDMIPKRKSEKEADPKKARPIPEYATNRNGPDPFDDDPYHWPPVLLVESADLKKRLLTLVRNMGERCKRVFESLFSEGDTKFMFEKFPQMNPEQIYTMVSRCRSQLKAEAMKLGILE